MEVANNLGLRRPLQIQRPMQTTVGVLHHVALSMGPSIAERGARLRRTGDEALDLMI
jgi:hypothetical protein